MRFMDCYFAAYIEDEIKKISEEEIADLAKIIEPLIIFSAIWSISVTSNYDGRKKFDAFFRGKLKEGNIEFPEEGLIFDYCFVKDEGMWKKWLDIAPIYNCDSKLPFNEIVVPTPDSIRMKYMMRMLILNKKHILTPGPTGTGKTVNIVEMMTYELPEDF